MVPSARKRIRHLVGAFCVAALLAATVGVTSAEAMPQTTKAAAESQSTECTGPLNPPGCV
ncbi:hypothetical protein GCM10010121_091130 [Streptomyces brasiliensis]|uniref:Uncharacterized protein n=1 Tax=Streptomyces brasiliensis TaxID=1954 RepID=A0A917P816_9ACTN|nr:hypothetical protein GCM10010121_091130 [Streptomyces brasiliensis]